MCSYDIYEVVQIGLSFFFDKKVATKRVGRLIWQSFNKCNCYETIEHINQKSNDDRLENLECVSMEQNIKNRNKIPRGQNKYNLTPEIKAHIQLGMQNKILNDNCVKKLTPSYSTWDVMKKYGIPLNYISQVFWRGSWKKYLNDRV